MQNEQSFGPVHDLGREPLRNAGDSVAVGRRADPEHGCTLWTHERQTPFGGGRRFRECLRNSDSIAIWLLLLRPTLNDGDIRRRPLPQEVTLAADRFEDYRKDWDKMMESYAVKTAAPRTKDGL